MKTVENIAKEAIKARVIDVKITWVSNYSCPIWKSSNRTVVIGHPRDRASITWQIGARRTNHDREFCYRYDYHKNYESLHIIADFTQVIYSKISKHNSWTGWQGIHSQSIHISQGFTIHLFKITYKTNSVWEIHFILFTL